MVVLAAGVLLSACSASSSPSAPAGTNGASSPSGAAGPAPGVKSVMTGLIDKGQSNLAGYVQGQPYPVTDPSADLGADGDAFSGIVVNLAWSQLEPTPDSYDFQALEQSLAAVSAYNRAHAGHALEVRLRVFAGPDAPAWVKSLGGPPISATYTPAHTPTITATLGRWWTASYNDAWSAFQHALADHFDDNPLIHSVAVTSCVTADAEPFILNKQTFLAAVPDGLTSALQQACLSHALAAYSGWRRTPLEYTFNSYPTFTQTGQQVDQDSFVDQVMGQCQALQSRTGQVCELGQHALSSPPLKGEQPVYEEMASLYAAHPRSTKITLQMNSPNDFGGCEAINLAVSSHALAVEVWPHGPNAKGFAGFTAYPESQLARWGRALEEGRQIACG